MVNEASGAGKANHKADEAYADADVLAYHAANDPNNRFLQDRAFLAQEYADALASAKTEEEIKEIESAKRIAEKYIKAEEDAAKEIEEARKKVETAIAKERKKEWNAYVKQAQKDLESLQDENAAAQDRLSAAQEKSRQAWGWYRDKDSLASQLEEERAEAAAQKQFEKDFEKLRFRRDWRTAAAYGSGKRGALSLDEEAVRRVALAREEEAAAKEYARKTAEECARSAAALEAIQNTICSEG